MIDFILEQQNLLVESVEQQNLLVESVRHLEHLTRKSTLKVWQTVPSLEHIPKRIRGFREVWISKNPMWNFHLLDDDTMYRWIIDNFPNKTVKTFTSLPLGVMRADLWRYMILLKEGGIYLDSDVEMLQRISEWKELSYISQCDVVIGLENDMHFCQWAIVSLQPNHRLFEHVVSFVLAKIDRGIEINNPHFVHATTGPAIFTTAVLDFYNASGLSAGDFYGTFHEGLKENSGVCLVDKDVFSKKYLSNRYLSRWKERERREEGKTFSSWTEEAENLHAFAVAADASTLKVELKRPKL